MDNQKSQHWSEYHLWDNSKPNSDHYNQHYQAAFKTSNPPKQTNNIPIMQFNSNVQVSKFMYFPPSCSIANTKLFIRITWLTFLNPVSSHFYHQTNKKANKKLWISNTSRAKQTPWSPTQWTQLGKTYGQLNPPAKTNSQLKFNFNYS